jgi:hypothetical protein
MASSNKPEKPAESLEAIAEIPISGRSLSAMLGKFNKLTEEPSPHARDYTVAELRQEYTLGLGVLDNIDDAQAVGRRWSVEVQRGEVGIVCEVTTYNEVAQEALIEAGLKKSRLGATVWFAENTGDEANGSSFNLLASLFRGGPQKHALGRGEINGDLSLAADITPQDEDALMQGAALVGAQMVFSHFAREAKGTTRPFFIEVPQAVGTDMVRAAGSLALLPPIE